MTMDQLAEPVLPDPADAPPRPPSLHIDIDADPTTGYAAIQNNLPVLRALTLTNPGDAALEDVEVLIRCAPAFAAGERLHFERLAAGEQRRIAPLDLKPAHGYLAALDESERGALTVSVSVRGVAAAQAVHPVEVLAYDQWAGTRALPELLAAFCMPNSPVVDRLIARASGLLRADAPGQSMSGYQSKNREHAWKQVSSIYSSIAALDLQYSNPPASFGKDGQKIRTPERVLDTQVATCLDLVMLFAACLEQAGLNPVLLLKEGHAWVGVWLVDATFPTALVDDVQAVRKRVGSGELVVFETTGVAGGAATRLRAACRQGEDQLHDDAAFTCAIDVRRAREAQIRPLPSRAAGAGQAVPVPQDDAPAIEAMPPLPPLDPAALPARELAADTPEGRLAKWKSRLLDLTLRNRLLNFKPSKTTLRVICPDLGRFEDSLAEGREFRMRAAPPLMTGADSRDAAVYAARHGATPLDALALDALGRGEIVVDSTAEALEARLLELFRAAATGLEEGGANTLFLAFGFLQWQESPDAEATHLAPILLIPVTLSRQSVRSGFRLTRHDDEALVNPTLRQKLAQDFSLKLPAFDVLPGDEKGIDVGAVLQTFRLHVGELKGWEVKETVELGIFSFTKYLMWKDLQDRHRQLQENSVVAHLINNPGKAFPSEPLGFEPRTLDQTHRPHDLFAPMLSDSSQLRAICVASGGRNLVIEGPPGTGKSQTITNLITHLLATGRTVLFVSEKMAALDVVHRRLSSLGLGAFCLELHSAKARKADVLKQLGTALEAAGTRTVRDWEAEAERLWALREDLNGVAEALHRVHSNELTIYEAIGTTVAHPDWRAAPMRFAAPDAHSRAELDALRASCRQMAALAGQLTGLSGHPLARIARRDWTPAWEQALLHAAAALETKASALQDAAARLFGLLGLDHSGLSQGDLLVLDELAGLLLAAPAIPAGVARAAHDESARTRLAVLRQHGLARAQAWDALGGAWREDVATLDAQTLRNEWTAASQAWWPKSRFAKRAVLARLSAYRGDGQRPPEAQMPALLDTLATLNREDAAISALAPQAETLLQDAFARHQTDWARVEAAEQWAARFAQATLRLAGGDTELTSVLRDRLGALVDGQRALLGGDMAHGRLLLAYRDAWRLCVDGMDEVAQLAGASHLTGEDDASPAALSRLLAMLQGWRQAARQLQPWSLWQRARFDAVANGMQGIVDALEAGEGGETPLASVAEYFEFSYRDWWVRQAIGAEPVLCAFSSADHERKIAEFRQADERFQTLTREYVVAKLAGQIPLAGGQAPGADSEMGKLRRELQKQRKHMPVRQLVQNLPTLMPRLKPCLLMSPLSVAQYLDAGHAQFDVVIFDEASQIPVWDAVGAIARGRQLVCVGDPKQLPPTSFFSRLDDGEETGEDALQDLESILDECLGIGMPQLTLHWHYRSRHESLITFSNVTYYDNALITFPSPHTEDTGVRFQRVHGVYDRGGSRTNRAEAEAIVEAIEAHYLDPAKRRQTVGVVTFNAAQQNLIERMLDERRRASPRLDAALAQTSQEPLFVKNLENVQGDERDIIYFSITYGPDAAGKLSLNFGPLNLEGGQRRLNVAVSRARQQVVIFSTLAPEQIDLSRVRASGVRDLKHYLEFAQRGPRALAEQRVPTGREPDSPFERQVIALLRERGWEVHPQVGVSGFRIDIGVVDPRAPGRYLLGVECDGASYHSAATARDRDRLRQHVLEGLGWELHRIWSTDWWIDPEQPARRLIARLEALANQPLETEPEPETEPAPEEPAPEAAAASDAQSPAAPLDAAPGLAAYRPCIVDGGEAALFYEKASAMLIRAQLANVIRGEGPVTRGVLFRRLARAWGVTRMTRRVEDHLARLVPHASVAASDGGEVYWPAGVDPAGWEGVRVPGDDPESRRGIDDIALEELGNAASYLLAQQGATSREGLARAVCRLLGISRTSADAEERIGLALTTGLAARRIVVEDGLVRALR